MNHQNHCYTSNRLFFVLLGVKSVETHYISSSIIFPQANSDCDLPQRFKAKKSGAAYLCVLKDEYPKAEPI